MLTSSAAAILRSKERLGLRSPRMTSEMCALCTPDISASRVQVTPASLSATPAMTSMLRPQVTQSQLLTTGKQLVYRRNGE